jgi:hypothetical protein
MAAYHNSNNQCVERSATAVKKAQQDKTIPLMDLGYYISSDTQEETILKSLITFYENQENMDTVQKIVNGESHISLRIIDWFVTNYSKEYETEYNLRIQTGILKDLVEECVFNVYNRYKLKLKSYSKKRFDPFCRWERISFPWGEGQFIETTIGQLNFFKWAIENRVLNYIEEHYSEIEKDMNLRHKSSSRKNTSSDGQESGGATRKKRQPLSVSASKCIKKKMVKMVVKFDN